VVKLKVNMTNKNMNNKIKWVKRLYLYIFSAVGLVLLIVGSVQIIDIALKAWIFTKADNVVIYPQVKPVQEQVGISEDKNKQITDEGYNKKLEEYRKKELASRRQGQASNAVAMILVGLPLFLYHWELARKES